MNFLSKMISEVSSFFLLTVNIAVKCYKELTIIDVVEYTEFFSPFLVEPNLLPVVDAH